MKKAGWYWTITILLVIGLLGGGITELLRLPTNVQGIMALGYPAYVVTILGAWKVLGSAALLAPGFPRLKEWAYAGIFFNMTGAAISHAVCHGAAWHVVVTLGFAALDVASWATRPQSRRLGVLFSGKTGESEGT
ncbi:MAG: DoxX family protein [Candidatus Acidiferrales bacterium]